LTSDGQIALNMDKKRRTSRDVLSAMREGKIEFLDLKFVDLFGTLQHITLPTEFVDEDLFHHGMGFDGSSVRGFQAIHESDMMLKPDPDTVFADPFFDDPTLSVFCDIFDPVHYKPYSRDPRGVAKRAEQAVRSLGLADTPFMGPEMEFFILDDVRFDQATQHGFYFLNTEGAFWNTGQTEGKNLGHRPARKRAYFAAPPADFDLNLRGKITKLLSQVGIEPELHHHEVGAGQNEIGMRFGPLTPQADNVIKFKYVAKNTARRYGKSITFMPKPLFEENGSGMHCHVSLWKEGQNLFYKHGRYADLSEMAEHFIAGLLHHAPAVCAFACPSTNSYRRLVPGYEAPINLVYSQRNRSACIRIPMSGQSSKAKRIEFRTPDPSSNPYLAFAAILMAGLDGVINKMKPPAPVDVDIYDLANAKDHPDIRNAPGSLEQALDALESDHEFLLRNGVFTRDLIDVWLRTKREKEIQFISLRPHPSEFELYFDV
jgi:glutamine synthetase